MKTKNQRLAKGYRGVGVQNLHTHTPLARLYPKLRTWLS
jgi:hypothetical protein